MSQNIFFCLIEVFIKFINNESIFLFLGELYMPPKSTSGPVTYHQSLTVLQTSVTTNITGPAVQLMVS